MFFAKSSILPELYLIYLVYVPPAMHRNASSAKMVPVAMHRIKPFEKRVPVAMHRNAASANIRSNAGPRGEKQQRIKA